MMTSVSEQGPQEEPGGHSSDRSWSAGFYFSLFGLLTAGILSPIGVLLGLADLFEKNRKRFTLAGIFIGLFGSALLVLMLGVLIGSALEGMEAVWGLAEEIFDDYQRFLDAAEDVQQYHAHTGTLPDQEVADELLEGDVDPWGLQFRYVAVGDHSYAIRSAGSDGLFDTADDLAFGVNLEAPRATSIASGVGLMEPPSVMLMLHQQRAPGELIDMPFDSCRVEVDPVEGSGEMSFWGQASSLLVIKLSEPGTYWFTFPEIPGYEPIPPERIEVGADVLTTSIVEVKKIR